MQEIEDNLKRVVYTLAGDIGPRAYFQKNALDKAEEFIVSEFRRQGYTVSFQPYEVEGRVYRNIYVEIRGRLIPDKILIIGAHYDTVMGTPGADDNASGVAGMLELARLLREKSFNHTIQFVAFTLEEPPFFYTRKMGSYQYAKALHNANKDLIGMICLESIGYFVDTKESQHFPLPIFKLFYPNRGDFIALVSNLRSKGFLNRIKNAFKGGTNLPVESISTFSIIPGIDFSDHRAFWRFGYNAVMVTDTAFYRNPNYHSRGDTHETLDYRRMAEVVVGLRRAVEEIVDR